MNIVKEEISPLNAILKLTIEESDYQGKVDNILKDYRKKMNMPGFRPGMVPMSIVKKMYGVAVKADEVNKMINDSISKFLDENKIEYLGNPIPKEEDKEKINFESQKDFTFNYDLGLAPQFEINISDKQKFTKYVIKMDEELIQKNIKDLCRRYGKLNPSEVSTEESMLAGTFTELDKAEGGLKLNSSLYLESIEDEKEKAKLVGLKKGDKVIVDPKKLGKDDHEVALMLGIQVDGLKKLSKNFEFEVISVYKLDPAAEDQKLYDSIFGPGVVTSSEEFRKKTSEELEELLKGFSNKKLKKDVVEHFIEKLKLSLPDDFLRKWLKVANKDVEESKIEEDYEKFAKDMRWMLVENKISKENNLQLTYEELSSHVKELLKKQFAQYGMELPEDDKTKEYINNILSNQEETRKISSEMMERKINDLFHSKLSLKEKEVSYDEFLKSLNEKPKFNLFNKLLKF